MSYETIKINDICVKVTSGGTPKSTNAEFYNPKEVPWLKTGEVNYCRIYDTETYISKEGLARSSAKLIPENSVIIAMYGQGDTAGRVAINKIPLSTNQACCNLVINHEIADYESVYYALSTLYDKLVSLKNGGAQPNLNVGIIKEVEIHFPKLITQKKIASILSKYDYLIENNQQQIKLLEEAAQRLYKEWFVDLHFPGYEDVEIVDGVPEGWKITPINMVTKLKAGGDKPKNFSEKMTNENKIPVFANGITKKGLMGFTDKAVISNPSVTISARGTVGIVFLRTEPYVPIVRLISVTPIEDKVDIFYLYLYLVNQNFRSTGAAQQQITVPLLKSKNIVCPSDDVRKSFNDVITPIFNKIEILEKHINKLTEARDRLLPKLMSGEIEVQA